jgi:hypothetical protein
MGGEGGGISELQNWDSFGWTTIGQLVKYVPEYERNEHAELLN